MKFSTVILADGVFPTHHIPLGCIRNAGRIVCCDGSVQKLIDFGMEPHAIAGDIDSLSDELAGRYADRIFRTTEQETNDLTKAVNWCTDRGFNDIAITGATGKREDHTIGNISLLAEYCRRANVIMITDTGIFRVYYRSFSAATFPGQQISIMSIDNNTAITSAGLKYPLRGTKLTNWWMGTLNEALGDIISLQFTSGRVIVFFKFA